MWEEKIKQLSRSPAPHFPWRRFRQLLCLPEHGSTVSSMDSRRPAAAFTQPGVRQYLASHCSTIPGSFSSTVGRKIFELRGKHWQRKINPTLGIKSWENPVLLHHQSNYQNYQKPDRVHCKENPIYVLIFEELCGLSPNFHIHVSVKRFIYSQD